MRYVHSGNIREDFVCFVDAFELTNVDEELAGPSSSSELSLSGQALGQIILTQIKKS